MKRTGGHLPHSVTELGPYKFVLPKEVLLSSNPFDLMKLTGCLQRQEI